MQGNHQKRNKYISANMPRGRREPKLLSSSCPTSLSAGGLSWSAINDWDTHQGYWYYWTWVHIFTEISLWIESNWNGKQLLNLTNLTLLLFWIQYWGWCKYRYREFPKAKFAAAKERVLQVLNACPIEVIRRFTINRSGRLLQAYGPVSRVILVKQLLGL
jgi:hypothetical protein